jgi:hypothetical protein
VAFIRASCKLRPAITSIGCGFLALLVVSGRLFGIGNSVGAMPTDFVVQRNATLKLVAGSFQNRTRRSQHSLGVSPEHAVLPPGHMPRDMNDGHVRPLVQGLKGPDAD